jgi:hypothetical protein
MEIAATRPKLVSFRALAFSGENRAPASGSVSWSLQMAQNIEVGLAVPTVAGGILQAVVKIVLGTDATSEGDASHSAAFNAEYEARFDYPAKISEPDVLPQFEQELYQYMLVAQAFPLAMTHFRRELQSMGFDARNLPLGI